MEFEYSHLNLNQSDLEQSVAMLEIFPKIQRHRKKSALLRAFRAERFSPGMYQPGK